MNLIDLASKFGTILRIYKLDNIQGSTIETIGKLFGYNIDAGTGLVISDFLQRCKTEYKLDSIQDVIKHPDLSTALMELFNSLSSIAPQKEASSENGLEVPERVHVDSLLICHHCGKNIHVRECVSLKLEQRKVE